MLITNYININNIDSFIEQNETKNNYPNHSSFKPSSYYHLIHRMH